MKNTLLFSCLAVIILWLCLSSSILSQSTFTVQLPKLEEPPDEEEQDYKRPLVWSEYNDAAYDDAITVPNGRPIYALIVSGYSQNGSFDELMVYNFAKHLMENGAYVHYAWWNNLCAPYMERPLHNDQSYPGNLGQDFTAFSNPISAQNKALPSEDYQFVADAKLLLSAIRQNNPNAIIIVVGHSMGGGAVVHLASQTNVKIDILAPIDPVGNRNFPWRFAPISVPKDYNWNRWRVSRDNFRGYKRVGLNLQLRCVPKGDWLSVYASALLLSNPICVDLIGVYVDPASTLTFGNNVVNLHHRWQKEFLFPFDYEETYRFGFTGSGEDYQQPVPMKPFGESDPGGWPLLGIPELEACCASTNGIGWNRDGHGEIIGFRGEVFPDVVPLGVRVRTSPNCGTDCLNRDWPWRWLDDDDIWHNPPGNVSARIEILKDLENLTDPWQHEPTNPDLCLVSSGLIEFYNSLPPPSIEEQFESILDDIYDLVEQGMLNQGQGNSLITKITGAQRKFNEGQYEAAVNKLKAFQNQVNAFINGRILSEETGNMLNNKAYDLIAAIMLLMQSNLSGIISQTTIGLSQNFPNPFNPSTVINFNIPEASSVSLKIYDVLGKEVSTLLSEEKAAGSYEVNFDASRLPSGTYIYEIRAGSFVERKKMILLK